MSKAQTSELIQTETSELIQTVKSPTSKLQKNFKKDAKILALSRKVTQLEEQLDICQSDIQLKEGQLSSLQEQLHQNINSTSMKTVESSKPMSDEVLNLKKMLKKKEARIAVLNKKINENVSTVTSATSSYPVLTDDFSTQQILDEANAKLFLEQERRDVLEKQLDELSTERADIVIQLDQIPLLRSLIEEKELALNDLKKLNSQLVLQNKELMKRLNMEQKTAETDLEFSRHLQAMLQSQNIKLSEQTDSIEAVEEKYLKREHHLLDKINLKENEIELLKHDMKKMTENVIETEILMKSVQTEISHYKQQISTLKEEIVSMGDAYTEQLNQVNGDVFEFMKNNLKIPRIVIGEEPLLDNKEIVNPDPEMQDYLKLKQNLQHMESNNQSLNEKVQKLEIQLQYEKDLAHSMATRYKEEVKEISELRTQVHKLQKKGSTSQNDDKEDDADSTISSNEAVENYERTENARLVERLRQDDYDLEILSDQKRDLERELDDVLDELHRKDDMLYQTKDELNSSLNFIDELESDLRDRNDEILSLKNMLEKSHTDVLHLRDELHYKDSLIGTISPKAPSSRTQSFESLDEVSSYQKKIQKKNAKILVLNKKIEKLTEEMQMSKSMDGFGEYVSDRITALESCVKERESQIKDLEAQIASYETSEVGDTKLRKLLKKKEAKILVLNKKLAELTTSVESSLNTSMHSDISVSQESLNNPESLSSMYTVDIQQKDQHIQELTKYISDLKSNLSYYQQVLVEKEAELVQGHAQLKETERMLSTVTNDQEKLKKVMQQNEEELECLNEKWTNAKQNLEESYSEQDMHYNQFQLVENQKADLELQILDMKKHHSEMSAYSEGLWNELGELKLNYETLLSEKEDLEVHVQKLSKEKEDVEVKILETQNEVQELRIEKDKLESDLTQTRDNLESEVKDNQTKESKIIQLTYTIQEIEKKSIAFQQSISEKDIVIEQLIEKLNVEQEQKNTTENLDKAVIKHLEEKHQNNLKEMEDLSETCQIQKANLEVTKHMLEEKDVLIEQLQQKSFDAESVGDLQASLSVKEHKISELLIEQEELNQKLTEINEAKEAAVNVNLNLKEENEEFRQQSINIQTDYVEMKQQHDDVQHRLDEANLLLLEKDWLLHDLQKQLQVSQSSQCNEESELHQEIIMKEKSLEEFKTVTSSLRSDLQALHQEKDQQVCNLSGEISDLKQELKSWQDREDQASSSMRIKDQDISELQEKLTTMQEYNSKMEEEFKNLYLKEKSYIEKCKQQSDVIHEFQTKLEATEADCNSKTLEIAELTQKIDKFIEDSKGGLEITSSDLPKLQSNLKRRDAKILILTKKLNDSQECLQQKSRELDDIKNASGERMYVKEVSTPDYFKQPQVVEEIMVRGENLSGTASIPHPEFEISESLEKQFSSLTSQLEESKQEIIQKNSELKSKQSQVEVIRDDFKKQLAELKHKLDSYSEAESLTTEKLGSSNTVVIDLQSKLDGYISALAEKDIQFIQQTTALQQKDSNIQQLTETISELNIQIQNYAETASKLKDQLDSQDEKLEVNLNHSNEKIQVLTSQLQEAINMKAELEVEFTQCRAELDNQKSIEESYLTQHVDAKQELERLTTIMQAFEVKEKNLQESLQTSITNEESLKSQLSGFQSQLETANQMLEQYQGNSSDKENELVLMIERNGSLEQKIKEVNQELQRNQSKIEEHQIKEQNLIESLQQATYEVVESKKKMAEVQSQYEEVKTKSTDQETNFAEMVEKFNQQIQIKADEIMHLQTEMENTQKTLQISIASVAEKDEKIKSLLGNFQEMEARLSQLTESKTDDSGEELEKAKAEIQEKQQALDDKVLTLKKALATAKKLKFQLQKSNEKVKELEDGREEEEKRKEELQKELQEKASELEEIRSSMQSLRTDVNNADVKELEDIKTQMQSYVEYSQQLQEQVQQLRETIFSSEQQLKQRQVVLDELEGESSNLKAETVELKSAYDCLRQEMVNITQMNEDYKHTVLDKEKHVLNLSKQIEDLDSGYLSLQQQLSYKDDLNSSLVIENTRLSTLESSFEDKLEELSKFHRLLQDFQISSSDQLNEQLLMVEAISGQLENMKESTVSLKEFTDLEKELSTLKSQLTENESCLSNMPMDDGGNLNDAVTERNKQIEMFKLVIQQEAQEKDKLQLLLDELKTAMAEKISDKDKELAVYIESLNSMQQKLVEKEENLQKVTKEDSTDGSLMVQLMEVIKENQTLKDEMNEMKIEGISQQTKSLEHNGNQLSEVTKENENLKLQFQQIQQINQENENLKNELQKQQAQQVALQPLSTDEEVISRRLQQSLFQISAEYESLKQKHEELILTNQVLRDELQAVPTTQVLATERTGGTWNMDANLEYDILKLKLDETLKENETLKMVLKNQSESQTPVMVSFTDDDHNKIQHNLAEVTQKHDQLKLHYGQLLQEKETLKTELEKTQPDQYLEEKANLEARLEYLKIEMESCISGKEKEIEVYAESLNKSQEKLVEKEEILQKTIKESAMMGQMVEYESLKMQFEDVVTENQRLKDEMLKQQAIHTALQPLETDDLVTFSKLQQALSEITNKYEILKSDFEKVLEEKENLTKQSVPQKVHFEGNRSPIPAEKICQTDENNEAREETMELVRENNQLQDELQRQADKIAESPLVSDVEATSRRVQYSLSELTKEYESLKLKYEDLESEKNLIQKLNKQLQEEKAVIKADFEMQIAVVENLQHLLKENQMTIDQLHAQDEDLNTKLQMLKAERDRLKEEIESLQGQCEGLEQIVASAQMSEMDSKNQVQLMQNQLEKAKNENKSLRELLDKSPEKAKQVEFTDKMEESLVREVLHQSYAAPSKTETEVPEIKEKYASLVEEHEKVKNKLHINEVKCEKMLHKLKAFKDKNEKLTAEIEHLKKSRDEVDISVPKFDTSFLESSLEEYKTALENSTTKCQTLGKENISLKDMVTSLKEQIKTIQNELTTKAQEVDMMKVNQNSANILDLEQKLKTLSSENQELREENIIKKTSIESLTDEYKIAESRMKDLFVQIEALTFREESLNHRLEEQTKLSGVLSEKLAAAEEELAMLRPVQTEISEIKAHHDQSLSDLNENFSLETSSLKSKLENLQEQYNMLEADNQEFLILSDNLRETVKKLKKDNEEKTYLLSKRDEELLTKGDNSEISSQLEIIEGVRNELLVDVESLKSDLVQWKSEAEKRSQRIQELEIEVGNGAQMKAKILELENERDELIEEMEGLRNDMIAAKREKMGTKDEFEKYVAQIDILKTDNQGLKEHIDGLTWKLEEASGYEEELQEVQQQLSHLEMEKVARQTSSDEEIKVQVSKLEVMNKEAESLRSDVENKKSEVEELKSELKISHERLSELVKVEKVSLQLQEELEQCRVTIEKQNRQVNELNIRLQTLDDLEVEFSELNEQYNKALNDKNDMAKQIQELHDQLQKLNHVEKEINLTVEQKDHFAREKDTLQQRVNDLESQGTNVTDENAKLKQELATMKSSLQQLTFESNSLKSQLQVASSSGDQMSQFQCEYDNLQKQFNQAIEQKNKLSEDLNEACHNHQHREQRCQKLAMQVSQLAEDRSYLNAQLGHLSKSLREKESEWSNMKNQYRSLYQTHMTSQMKMVDLEKKVISETFQKAHGSSTKTSVLGHIEPNKSLIEEYKQKLESSEKLKEESKLTIEDLQEKLDKEEKRSAEIEKMLKDTQDQLLLQATRPLQEVRLQIDEDDSDSKIREHNALLTRRGMGYCRRLQRWMKVKNRQLTRIMKFRPGIRKCLWAYFIFIHVLIVMCFTGFL